MNIRRRLALGIILAAPALTMGGMAQLSAAIATPRIGQPAPNFVALDSNGQTVRLQDFRGKVVVLEWTNDGCPFVGKWYRSGAMQQLQRDAAAKGVVWLSVISSAPGEQGYADGPRANALTRNRNAAPAHVLLDASGTIGRAYGAEVTPHIFVIAQNGTLAYVGGADSIASTRTEDLARAEPYAREAIEAVVAGQPVQHPVTRPYGCTVKYSS